MKKVFSLILLLINFPMMLLYATTAEQFPVKDQEGQTRRIFLQGNIINEGSDYAREFKFDLAFQKYLEATKPQYLNEETDKSYPLSRLSDLYRELGKCKEALDVLSWHKQNLSHPRSQAATQEKKAYLDACVAWYENEDKSAAYAFIDEYKRKYKAFIPPKLAKRMHMATIAELYDLIGDYDAGIKWVNVFRKADKSEPLKRTRKEYDALLKAFEESKQGQPKVCSEDGKYCVGRATAVIIRSEYF